MLLRAGAFVAILALAGPAFGQTLNWPADLVTQINWSAAALRTAEGVDGRRLAFAPAREALEASAKTVPGAALTLHIGNTQLSSQAAMAELTAALAGLGGATDAGGLRQRAVDILAAVAELNAPGSTGVPPTPSAAHAVSEAIERYDEVAAALGAPSLREIIVGALPEEIGEHLNTVLDQIEQINEVYENLEDVAAGDTDAIDDFVGGVMGLLPPSLSPAFSGPAAIAFGDLMEWNGEMYDAAADGLNVVADAIETGRVDQDRLNQITDRLNNLSRGPWGGDTARDFFRSWCDLLPALNDLCEQLVDEVADAITGANCAAIDCDCANVGGGLLAGPNRVTCEITQQDLRAFCTANGRIEGVCGPAGPAAFPR